MSKEKVHNGKELKTVLTQIGNETGEQFGIVLQKLSIDAFRDLVEFSARDTGFLRSNWDVAKNNAPNEKLKNPGGSYASAKFPSIKIEAGDHIILYNNTEYARYLEHGTPFMSSQPMVEPTYQRVLSQANRLAKKLSKEKVDK